MELKDIIAGTGKTQNQNLINPARVSGVIRPIGFYRSIIIDLLSVGSALFFGYAYYGYLIMGLSPLYMFIAILLFSVVSVLQVFLQKNASRRALVILGEAVAFVAFFSMYDDWLTLLIICALVLAVLLFGYWRARSYLDNNIEISFFGITRRALGKVTTAALLFMVLAFAPHAKGSGLFVPRDNFRALFDWSSGLLNNAYPGVPFTGSFGDLTQNFARTQLESNPSFNAMSISARNAAVEQAVAQLSGEIKKVTGVAPALSDLTSDVAYNYIIAKLAGWQVQLQDKFLIGWAIAAFLIFRTAGIAFVWVAQFISLMFYEILISLGFMRIAEVTQTKETVEY